MPNKMEAKARDVLRRSELRNLRHSGMIPAVVYGKEVGSVPLAISEKELIKVLKDDPNAVIDLDVPGKGNRSVMVNAVQRDKVKRNIIHVDFREVDLKQNVVASVRLELIGNAAGVRSGGVLQIELRELEVESLPAEIPQQLELDISALEIGDSLTVKDVSLPEGVTSVTDGDTVVVTVLPPQKNEEETDDAAGSDSPDTADSPEEGGE